MDMRSDGKPSFVHMAIVVSSVSSNRGSKFSVVGIGGSIFFKNGVHIFCNKSLRNCFVKQPTYDMKAVINRMSPGKVIPCLTKLKIEKKTWQLGVTYQKKYKSKIKSSKNGIIGRAKSYTAFILVPLFIHTKGFHFD